MQDISVSLTAVVFVALIALLVAAAAAPVEIAGTLQNVRAVPLSGKIMAIQETPHMNFTPYEPALSRLTAPAPGNTQMEDTILGDRGATVVVQIVDAQGVSPVPDPMMLRQP